MDGYSLGDEYGWVKQSEISIVLVFVLNLCYMCFLAGRELWRSDALLGGPVWRWDSLVSCAKVTSAGGKTRNGKSLYWQARWGGIKDLCVVSFFYTSATCKQWQGMEKQWKSGEEKPCWCWSAGTVTRCAVGVQMHNPMHWLFKQWEWDGDGALGRRLGGTSQSSSGKHCSHSTTY